MPFSFSRLVTRGNAILTTGDSSGSSVTAWWKSSGSPEYRAPRATRRWSLLNSLLKARARISVSVTLDFQMRRHYDRQLLRQLPVGGNSGVEDFTRRSEDLPEIDWALHRPTASGIGARMLAPSSYAGTKTVSGEGGTCGLARLWSLSPNSENSTKDVPEWPRDRRLRDWNTAAAYRRGAPWLLLPS